MALLMVRTGSSRVPIPLSSPSGDTNTERVTVPSRPSQFESSPFGSGASLSFVAMQAGLPAAPREPLPAAEFAVPAAPARLNDRVATAEPSTLAAPPADVGCGCVDWTSPAAPATVGAELPVIVKVLVPAVPAVPASPVLFSGDSVSVSVHAARNANGHAATRRC